MLTVHERPRDPRKIRHRVTKQSARRLPSERRALTCIDIFGAAIAGVARARWVAKFAD